MWSGPNATTITNLHPPMFPSPVRSGVDLRPPVPVVPAAPVAVGVGLWPRGAAHARTRRRRLPLYRVRRVPPQRPQLAKLAEEANPTRATKPTVSYSSTQAQHPSDLCAAFPLLFTSCQRHLTGIHIFILQFVVHNNFQSSPSMFLSLRYTRHNLRLQYYCS